MSRILKVEDVMEMTGYKRNAAYALIRRLNWELEEAGRVTFPGRIDRKYFMCRVFGEGEDGCLREG